MDAKNMRLKQPSHEDFGWTTPSQNMPETLVVFRSFNAACLSLTPGCTFGQPSRRMVPKAEAPERETIARGPCEAD